MSASSRSRQKRKLEPISIEELAGTTGMSGFCTFLTRDASVPVPILDHLETGAPESPAPVPDAAVPPALETAAPEPVTLQLPKTGAPEPAAPLSGAELLPAPETTAPEPL